VAFGSSCPRGPYLGHRNIQHTVGYTQLAADRFSGFWQDDLLLTAYTKRA